MGCNPSKDGEPIVGNRMQNEVSPVQLVNNSGGGTNLVPSVDMMLIPLTEDNEETRGSSNSSSSSSSSSSDKSNGKERSKTTQDKTMKTSEETVDFEKEFRPDDTELCHAATKIQASFRGHMTRKQQAAGGKDEPGAAGGAGSAVDGLESQLKNVDINKELMDQELLDVDLADPELHKAATKIQASFRGHKARKSDDVKQ
ncbi:uncharacterized protein LOC126836817 [Adelges cooleyi]|uniref:uncharacterized protein LOC126836817 n=1 Tax=Adelges cooleyi TaxID=133065 RepID=UPI00217F5BE0|nr:uncharacterized protein LOC126836817 [Adelges cooleyi]